MIRRRRRHFAGGSVALRSPAGGRSRIGRWWGPLAALVILGCATTAAGPPVAPSEVEGLPFVNPTLPDGRVVFRAFGDHHPECFAFVAEDEDRETETVACPAGAVHRLERCPAGRLHRGPEGCICVPIEGDAERVPCPD